MAGYVEDLRTPIDPTMLLVLQNPNHFNLALADVDRNNYLFYLAARMFAKRLSFLNSPGTEGNYLLGVYAYQVVSAMSFEDQPTFAVPPDERIALDMANRIGTKTPDQLIDVGIERAEGLPEVVPLLTGAVTEIVDRYTKSRGSARIAMGGVAMMRSAHVEAAQLLDKLHAA